MGIRKAVTIGSGVGAVAAAAIYVAAASPLRTPEAGAVAVARATPTVPVFTRTSPAPCEPPSVLEGAVCVVHVARVRSTPPSPAEPEHEDEEQGDEHDD